MLNVIRTLTLPNPHANGVTQAPCITFPMDQCMLRLSFDESGRRYCAIMIFDRDGKERFRIDNTQRDWPSAVVNVGKFLADYTGPNNE